MQHRQEKWKKRRKQEEVSRRKRRSQGAGKSLSLWTLKLRDLRISEMTLDCDVIKKRNASDNLLVKVETIEFHNNCQLKSIKCV